MSTEHAIRVLIADDHPVFRAGLLTVVQDSTALECVGEAKDGEDALAQALEFRPEVILMDIHMPGGGGIEATRQIVSRYPEMGVLMLTMLEDDTSVFAAMRAGARGYLVKGATPDDIVRAIVAVAAGEAIFSPSLAKRMTHFFTAGRAGDPHPFPDLSPRERDILDLIAAGSSNPEIAARLAISEKTVRNNVSVILAKLQVTGRSAAIVEARKAGLGSGLD